MIYEKIENEAIRLGIKKDILYDYMNTSVNLVYRELANNISLNFAIFIEYQRWCCYEWPNVAASFNLAKYINENKIHGSRMAYLNNFQRGINIKYEYFWHFNQLAMSFAMKENEKAAINLKSLQDFDASTTRLLHLMPNLSQIHFETLLSIMKKEDIHDIVNKKRFEKNSHVTNGKFDRKAQIEALLSNIHVCNDLKNKSLSLDYWWMYSNYC